MKKLFVVATLLAAVAIPAGAQTQQALTPGHLPTNVRPTRYEITVTPNAAALTLAGDVRIDIDVTQPTNEIVLNALELTFDHVDLDGGRTPPRVTFDTPTQTAHLAFASPITAGHHTLAISYHGRIYQSSQGMFASDYDTANGGHERALFTQFEAADARRFVPSFDEPLLKAIFQINAIVPANRMAVSNMPAAGEDALPNGMKRVRFQPTPIMSSYLMFLGVGDFERITTNVDGVEIGVITKRGDTADGRFALASAAQILRYYNEYFGTPYPLPKLDLIAGPGSGGFGAMENWGAIFYFERALLVNPQFSSESDRQGVFNVIAHEMAHQWFGDLVTMAWWDDIWLNEGFASWMQGKAAEHFHPDWDTWLQGERGRQGAMEQDSHSTTHPIVQQIDTVDQANEAFDNISYQKGRAVIRMIETYVGPDTFRDGVRAYIRAHAHGNARTADLWDAIEHASSQPMRQIADEFTHQPGLPLITMDIGVCRGITRDVVLHQSRFGYDDASRAPTRWHVPVEAVFPGRGGRAGAVTGDNGSAHLSIGSCGPFVVNSDQTGYYRVLYPHGMFENLAHNFGRLTPHDQYGLLADARALGSGGLAPYSDFYELSQRTSASANPVVLTLIADQLAATDLLHEGLPSQDAYRAFGRSVLAPMFARVGWDHRDGESDNTGVLREHLITALARLGDTAIVAEAQRRLDANTLTGGVRQPALQAIGAAADEAAFNNLLNRAKSATSTVEKSSYYLALAHVRDPALAERLLSHAFDADVTTNLGARIITTVSELHPEMAWRFAQAHQTELAARLDSLSRMQFMPGLLATSNDPHSLQLLRNYIDTSVAQDVRRDAEAAYQNLQLRQDVRAHRVPQLDAWIGAHAGN